MNLLRSPRQLTFPRSSPPTGERASLRFLEFFAANIRRAGGRDRQDLHRHVVRKDGVTYLRRSQMCKHYVARMPGRLTAGELVT